MIDIKLDNKYRVFKDDEYNFCLQKIIDSGKKKGEYKTIGYYRDIVSACKGWIVTLESDSDEKITTAEDYVSWLENAVSAVLERLNDVD